MKRSSPRNVFYFFSEKPQRAGGSWQPNVDIYETDSHVVVALEVPGVKPADLEVIEHREKLMVRGVRHPEMAGNPRRFHQIEIVCGDFEKEIILAEQLRGAPVEAVLSLGILYLKIDKNARTGDAAQKRIQIEAE